MKYEVRCMWNEPSNPQLEDFAIACATHEDARCTAEEAERNGFTTEIVDIDDCAT